MTVKIYISLTSGLKEVKKRQQKILMILDSKNIKYEILDISEPGKEADKDFMQSNSTSKGGTASDPDPRHPLPPQVFNDEEYCGDFEQFELANEIDNLEDFLKLPPEERPQVNKGTLDTSKIDENHPNGKVIDDDEDKPTIDENKENKTEEESVEGEQKVDEEIKVQENAIEIDDNQEHNENELKPDDNEVELKADDAEDKTEVIETVSEQKTTENESAPQPALSTTEPEGEGEVDKVEDDVVAPVEEFGDDVVHDSDENAAKNETPVESKPSVSDVIEEVEEEEEEEEEEELEVEKENATTTESAEQPEKELTESEKLILSEQQSQ